MEFSFEEKNNREIVKNIFERNPKFFIEMISEFHPLRLFMFNNEKIFHWHLICRFNNLTHFLSNNKADEISEIEFLNWQALSLNKNIEWTEDLINSFKHKWDWNYLSENESINWSEKIIDKFIDNWNWIKLSANNSLPFTSRFIEKYEEKWN